MQVVTETGERFFLQTPLYTVENTAAGREPAVEPIPVPQGSTLALYTNEGRAEEAIRNGHLTDVVPKRIGSDKELRTLLTDFQKKGIDLVSIDGSNRPGQESGRCLPIVSLIDAK
jgi:hypothetical protein